MPSSPIFVARFFGLVLACGVIGGATVSSAAVILPGQSVVPSAENRPVGGTVVASMTQPFATANFTGTLASSAIAGDASNPYGGLTFVYVLTNAAISMHPLQRLTINGYIGWITDMSYASDGAIAPTAITRDVTGGVVGFTFGPMGDGATLLAGTSSDRLVIQTDRTEYQGRIANISNNAVAPVLAYGPASFVPDTPEPSSVVGAIAAGSVGVIRRRVSTAARRG